LSTFNKEFYDDDDDDEIKVEGNRHSQGCKNPRREKPSVSYVRTGNIALCLKTDTDGET